MNITVSELISLSGISATYYGHFEIYNVEWSIPNQHNICKAQYDSLAEKYRH